jgi:hypothetical protein
VITSDPPFKMDCMKTLARYTVVTTPTTSGGNGSVSGVLQGGTVVPSRFLLPRRFLVGFWDNWFFPNRPKQPVFMARKWQEGDDSRITGRSLKAALGWIKT